MFGLNMEPLYRLGSKVMVHSFYDLEFIGFEKIPQHGPALLISNHVSYVDGLVVQAGCSRSIRFVIDRYIYEIPLINYFMRHNRAIPIRPKKHEVERAFSEVSHGLENGDLIHIFPEGRLTFTGHLGRFKPGVVWIIDRDPVPIYPIALKGLWGGVFSRKYIKSKWRFVPRSFRPKITAICGDPIHPGHVSVDYLQRTILNLKHSI